MINGDPTTFLFCVDLKIIFPHSNQTLYESVQMGGSNYEEAKQNAINCYKRWYPECEIVIWDAK